MNKITENFLELIEIEDVIHTEEYTNMVDISVEEDESFLLSNGIISHNSAISAVRKFRDSNIFGAFPLRGKFINALEMTPKDILLNEEAKNLIASLNISIGEKVDNSQLRYGKIYLYTDADSDGNAISALLINFFFRFWPELFEQKRIFKVMTPLKVLTPLAKKGKEKKYFYTNEEYETWCKKENSDLWDVEYKKGLASLLDDEYETILTNPQLVAIKADEAAKTNLEVWFDKNDTARKKDKILGIK